MSKSSDFCERGNEKRSKKKMKSAREVSRVETVHEARVCETFNVNLESASDVKSQPFDQDTCAQIKTGTGKRPFGTLCTSCQTKPRRSARRGP